MNVSLSVKARMHIDLKEETWLKMKMEFAYEKNSVHIHILMGESSSARSFLCIFAYTLIFCEYGLYTLPLDFAWMKVTLGDFSPRCFGVAGL